ncbi:MAG: putative ABC transporter permease [Ruminococcus sp.]|nr:putative ABC transporter permease [Ruminococcus sp.]
MTGFIKIAFLFAVGSMIGWVLEFFYRKFFDPVNVERKWLNPGFLTGPYLPLYGFALLLLYCMSRIERFLPIDNIYLRKTVLFIIMAAAITLLEYLTGLIFIVRMKIMLWDYTQFWGNIQGIICPLYTFFWLILSLAYCFFIDPAVTTGVEALMDNLEYSFFVGTFYGVFFIDLGISINNIVNIAEFAREHNIIVKIDELREQIQNFRIKNRERPMFFLPLRFTDTLHNNLERYREFREKLKLSELKGNLSDIRDNLTDRIKHKK